MRTSRSKGRRRSPSGAGAWTSDVGRHRRTPLIRRSSPSTFTRRSSPRTPGISARTITAVFGLEDVDRRLPAIAPQAIGNSPKSSASGSWRDFASGIASSPRCTRRRSRRRLVAGERPPGSRIPAAGPAASRLGRLGLVERLGHLVQLRSSAVAPRRAWRASSLSRSFLASASTLLDRCLSASRASRRSRQHLLRLVDHAVELVVLLDLLRRSRPRRRGTRPP